MPRRRPLHIQRAAERFRTAIRASLFGNIGKVEPQMAARMGRELFDWLEDVVSTAMRETKIQDRKSEMANQLHAGVTVIGRASLRTMIGRIDAYPWVFPHEFGGELEPHTSAYLTIPIFYGLRGDGSPKYRTANAWRRFGSFIYTNKSTGKKFIAYKGANGDLRILYVLVDKVTIPKRLNVNRIADARLGRLISDWTRIYVQEASRVAIVPPFLYRG